MYYDEGLLLLLLLPAKTVGHPDRPQAVVLQERQKTVMGGVRARRHVDRVLQKKGRGGSQQKLGAAAVRMHRRAIRDQRGHWSRIEQETQGVFVI